MNAIQVVYAITGILSIPMGIITKDYIAMTFCIANAINGITLQETQKQKELIEKQFQEYVREVNKSKQ